MNWRGHVQYNNISPCGGGEGVLTIFVEYPSTARTVKTKNSTEKKGKKILP